MKRLRPISLPALRFRQAANGKTKKTLETLTGADFSIYGHTIAIIADFQSMDIAKKAIDMLLTGSKHASVYRFIEREMKKLRTGSFLSS